MEIQLYKTKGLAALITFLSKKFHKKSSRSISILTGLMGVCVLGFSQTTSLSFTQIPVTDPEIVRPGGGAEQWTAGQNIVNIPTQGTNTQRVDAYYRFQWIDLQPSNSSGPGQLDFTIFDAQINDAINKGQGFNFGVMPNCCNGPSVGGAGLVYPLALHNAMQAESQKDWISTRGSWYENPNSPTWLTWFKALHQALNNHIQNTSYNGVPYKNVVKRIDVRVLGDFGEQAVLGGGPAPTDAAIIGLIDAIVQSYPNIKCVAMIGSFGANTGVGISSAAVGKYELTTSNNAGLLGWRWDSWGWTDSYIHSWLENNPNVVNGFRFDTAIMNRYKYAPVCGEPADLGIAGNFDDLPVRVNQYHAESFGNGNLDVNNPPNSTIQDNFRAASKAAGFRLILTGGSMTSTLSAGSSFNLTLNWQNIGVAPTYENWNVVYELRNSANAVVWSGTSSFNPRLFSPAASPQATSDNFSLPASVPQGTYSMFLIVKDPNAYRKPLPMAITGRNADGSYLLRSNITVGTGGPANQLPTANAGADQTIQLPASSVSLTGSGTDADGSIASYAWTQLSGPAGATITTPSSSNTTITGLTQGVYIFTLTTTDNQGGKGTDNVQITVNAATANQTPVANAGTDQTIQLPASSVALTGSGTDTDGSIASYAWTQSSGPAGATITTATASNTTITGLIQGVYIFTLTTTDNQGGKGTDNVQITVNAAAANQPPVANAGSDMNITLPTNTVSVSGSASKDPNGTISSYTWTKIAGPTSYTIANSSAMGTSISNLASGVYAFQLKVMDNAGAIGMDTMQVTVNPATPSNQPPIANAGADQNITLPINSVTINGSASSDLDGSISSYLWTKLSGPSQFNLGNSGTASTLLSNLAAGVYTFQLKVTDNAGAIALDTTKIIVNAALVNQPPVANAGADISITLPTNTANLNGSASSDGDGTISSYTWSQISGPNTASITSGNNSSTAISSLQQGVYLFALKVVDNNGASDLDSIKVTVNKAANQHPVANAGSSKSITLPVNSTSLNGTLSSDPDGNISSYSWSQTAGPSTAEITNGDTSVATAASLVAGIYTFQLTVTDNSGASSNASVKITVNAAGIQPPVANAGADQTITLPANSVIIDGSGSAASSGNSIVSYVWTEKSGPSTVSLTNTAQNTLSNLQAGKYVFMLLVTDNNAATGNDSVAITVNPAANQAPVANAGSGINLTLPKNSTNLDGTKSTDPDGTITTYAWTGVSGPNTPTLTGSNTATPSVSGMIAGQYTYQLTVTDNSGTSSSAQVKIKVSAASNQPPVANAGPDLSITAPASTANPDGSASSDADGTIASYNWVMVSGPGPVTISNSNTAKPSVAGLQSGGYVFELTVTDNSGAVSKDQVWVIVQSQAITPNQAPVANAGNGQTVTLPVNSVTLDGKNSFDPDGILTAYSWKQVSGPGTAGIATENVSSTIVSNLMAGQYIFELTVTDNNGSTNVDRTTITVNPSTAKLNMPPVAISGASDTISLPTSKYTLDATQSIDPDGTISSYQWEEISGPNTVTSTSMSSAKVDVSNLQSGEYEFRLTVTDNAGASSNSSMKLTVEPGIVSHNLAQTNRLSVYPNPAHSIINQRITSKIMGTVQINIYDIDGKLVYSAEQQKTSDVLYNSIVVSQLAPGMYTIQVNIANQQMLVSKFIKY